MRPARNTQSALRAPLNRILGTEANVRILRALALADAPLTRSELVERVGLSLPGVSAAVERLRGTGIIEFVGLGGQQMIQLRASHPLCGLLRTLFRAEAIRADALLDELRALAGRTESVRAAWIEGPAAEGKDGPNEPVVLGFLASSREMARVTAELGAEIARVEHDYDVTVELRGRTEADLATVDAEQERVIDGARSLLGPHPSAYLAAGREAPVRRDYHVLLSHNARDEQSIRAASWIAELLNRDPTLPKRARGWLVHRMHDASEQESHELMEWLRLLDSASIPRLQHTLLATGERSTRLRQSNPFVPVLTEAERTALRKATAS